MLRVLALLVLAAPLAATAAQTVDAAKIAHQGNGHGAAPCMACHGADGAGIAAIGNPRLAGLDAAYLARQLDDYANGTRVNPVMQPNAKALSVAERMALARYYSALPVPAHAAAAANDPVGERLALHGDWSRQLPGCVQCHGPGGVGVGANFPPLAGQGAGYIAAQLHAWQAGTRHNDPLGLMRHVAQALTPQEITAVSVWFAAQPLPAAGAKP